MYFTNINIYGRKKNIWISKENVLMKQSKAEVIAKKKCNINVLKMNIMHNSVYTAIKNNDFNN